MKAPCSSRRSWTRQRLALAVLLLICGWAGAVADAGAEPARRALLIGIDRYQAVEDLAGAVNDVRLLQHTLIGKFDFAASDIEVLTNAAATRANILAAIEDHLIAATPPGSGDIVVLHYSGHGSTVRDVSGDESDGLDETIVPHDSRQGDIFDISDDEIHALLRRLTERTPNIVVILDSCHSGSAARGSVQVRAIPADPRPSPASLLPISGVTPRGLQEGGNDLVLPADHYVLVSGARADQSASEILVDNRSHGALTYFLTQTLRAAHGPTTWRDAMDAVSTAIAARLPDQDPQLEGGGADAVVFGAHRLPSRPYFLVEPVAAGIVALAGGAVHGITPGSLFAVYPPGTRNFDTGAGATAQASTVEAFTTQANIENGGKVAAHSRAVLTHRVAPAYTLPVFLDLIGVSLRDALQEALDDYEIVALSDDRATAELQVRHTGDGLVLLRRDDATPGRPLPATIDGARRLASRIVLHARWQALVALDNPDSPLDIALYLRRVGAQGATLAPRTVPAGATVRIDIANRSRASLYPILLNLSADGSVNVLYPTVGQPDALAPGRSHRVTVRATLPAGHDRTTDIVKAITTTRPIDARLFTQLPARRGTPEPGPDDEDPLARLLRRTAEGRTGQSAALSIADWTVRQTALSVVRDEHPGDQPARSGD